MTTPADNVDASVGSI